MLIRKISCVLGYGILGGLAGTAAITLSQLIEMSVTGRKPSNSPSDAAKKVLGLETTDGKSEGRFNQLIHWAYGTTWGLFRSLLGQLHIRGFLATTLHFGAIEQNALWMLPALKVAPPAKEWGRKSILTDMLHHSLYALAAGWVVDRLQSEARWYGRFVPRGVVGRFDWIFPLTLGPALAAAFLMQGGADLRPKKRDRAAEAERRQEAARSQEAARRAAGEKSVTARGGKGLVGEPA